MVKIDDVNHSTIHEILSYTDYGWLDTDMILAIDRQFHVLLGNYWNTKHAHNYRLGNTHIMHLSRICLRNTTWSFHLAELPTRITSRRGDRVEYCAVACVLQILEF